VNRRDFISAAASGAVGLLSPHRAGAAGRGVLRHASIGGGGMAWSDVQAITSNPAVKMVAVADVDLSRISELRAAFPEVRVYQDWRRLLEREARNIDSINVTVPDHMHAAVAMSAMRMGKHCFCQKPLGHDLFEVRAMTRLARESGVVTQMGIQFHSFRSYRQAVALIRSGVIGEVREVHSWTSKQWGGEGPPPRPRDPVPEGMDWDLWLGGAESRPFVAEHYHPGVWRRRLDFGTGTFGDMGCHILDPVFWALELSAPSAIRSEGPAPDAWNWPTSSRIRYGFRGTRFTGGRPVEVWWYDGEAGAPEELRVRAGLALRRTAAENRSSVEQGSIFVGTGGLMFLPHPGAPRLFPEERFRALPFPALEQGHHWTEWTDACLGGGRPGAAFDYSGPLTEMVLLGSVAVRFPGRELRWDSEAMRFPGAPEADLFIRRRYRDGWEVPGL
jgi:predicted dehydrogenase